MKQSSAIFAGLLAIGLAYAQSATAQFLPYPAPDMPPHEVVALVRSTGLEPVGRPIRRGPAYVQHAVNPAGREVRVIIDARLRRVARVVMLGPARAAAADVPPLPAPYGRPPADIAGVPDGNGPAARVGGLPPDDAEPYGPSSQQNGQQPYGQVAAVGSVPVAPTRTPAVSAAPVTSQASPPPLPRPRPKLAAADPVAPAPVATAPAVAPVPAASESSVQTAAPAQSKGISASAAAEIALHEPVYEQYE